MNDTRYSIPLWKRITLCVLVFLSLFFLNLKIFSVRARANVVDGPASDALLVHIGAPFIMNYSTVATSSSDVLVYNGVLVDPNVYYIGSDFTDDAIPNWHEGIPNDTIFNLDYSDLGNGAADLFINSSGSDFSVHSFSLSYPVFFYPALKDSVDFSFGFHNVLGQGLDIIRATYSYRFCVPVFSSDDPDSFYLDYEYVVGYHDAIRNNNNYYTFTFFGGIDDSTLNRYYAFESPLYDRVAWLVDCYITFTGYLSGSPIDTWTDIVYLEPVGNSLINTYDSWARDQSDIIRAVVDPENLITYYDFEDISWTDWLVNSVSSFMNFEIVPNLSFSGMLALLVGMSLFIVFLKVFAGG